MLGIAAVVLILTIWAVWPTNELGYKGRPYKSWVYDNYEANLYVLHGQEPVGKEAQRRAQEAIRSIGTNGIPTLIEMLNFKASRPRTFLVSLRAKKTPLLWRIAPGLYSADDFRSAGVEAFRVLGEDARPAMPALEALMTNSHPDVKRMAMRARVAVEAAPSPSQ